MAKMVNPEVEVVRFENEDVIAGTSVRVWYNGAGYDVSTAAGDNYTNVSREEAARYAAQYYSSNGQVSDAAYNSIYNQITKSEQDQYVSHNGGDSYTVIQ